MAQLGSAGGYYYQSYPKADGGYDYIRTVGGYAPNGSNLSSDSEIQQYQPFSISQADTQKELGGSGGGGGGVAADPNAAQNAQVASNTQSALDRLGGQQNAGNASIDNSYNSALSQLLQGYNVANRNYGEAKQGAATNFIGAKNTIGSQAGEALNGLLRLLGSKGAGGGSANRAVREAVARGATLQRGDVGNTFAQNNRSLDTNWGDFTNNYNQQRSSADQQRTAAKQKLENDINTNRASLLQTLASLRPGSSQAYLNQANSLLDKTANYVTPEIKYQTQAYQAPSLSSYNTAATPLPGVNTTAGNDYTSPFLQSLLGKKQQQAVV